MPKLKTILPSKKIILILGVLGLYIFITTKVITYSSKYQEQEEVKTGRIISYSLKEDKITLIIKGKEKVQAIYYLNPNEENYWFKVKLGSYVRLTGNFKKIKNNTVPNTFNYKKYLYNKHIYFNFIIKKIEILKEGNIFYKIKDYGYKKILNRDYPEFLLAFIMGDKSLIGEDIKESMQINGTMHLLSISGMHVSLLVSFVSKFFKRSKFRYALFFLLSLFYIFWVGFPVSVLRVMLYLFLKKINDQKELNYSNKQLLILTMFILLIINPFYFYDYGFWYSYLITYGLFVNQDTLKGNYFISILKVSWLASIFSLPITALMNYEINLVSLLANVIMVPFVSLIVFPISLISFIISNHLWKLVVFLLLKISLFFSYFKLLINIPKLPMVLIILYYLIAFKKRKKKYVLLILILVINGLINKINPNFTYYFVDVGQGDQSIIISPYQKEVVMIDTGGNKNTDYIGKNTILFLKSIGITKIDYLILSHGDYDHLGESFNLVANFKVKNVIFNQGSYNELEQSLINILNKQKINYYQNLAKITLKDYQIYFLNNEITKDENEDSNVLYLAYQNYNFLLMGDAGITREEAILKKYNLPPITFLKVGHHGSKTSSGKNFLAQIKPQYSLIGVGENNVYHHPNEEVLKSLASSHIYRTDLEGTIKITIHNQNMQITTYPP